MEFFFGDSQQQTEILVDQVLSVDTLRLKNGKIIKLIGIRPNEYKRKREKKERDKYGFVIRKKPDGQIPFEEIALNFVVDLLEGRKVRLEFDVEKKDADDVSWAYVFLSKDNLFVNAEILKEGVADLRLNVLNTKYNDELRAAYKSAQEEKKGIHGQ